MSLFTWQMFTRHHCVPCLPLGPCNGIQPLLSRSSQVMGEVNVGLAQYFTRNILRVQHKFGRRAFMLQREHRKKSEELLGCFERWTECIGEEGRGHAVQCLHLVLLRWSHSWRGHWRGQIVQGLEHNMNCTYVKNRSLDFILKAVRSRCTIYKQGRA